MFFNFVFISSSVILGKSFGGLKQNLTYLIVVSSLKGPSINYVVSVGGEGGTPKDDLRRRGQGGSKEKLCRLFAEGKKKISREKLLQNLLIAYSSSGMKCKFRDFFSNFNFKKFYFLK